MFLFSLMNLEAQNKPIIYGFDKIPQTLLLNPGAEPTYKYNIGMPLLSGVSASPSISGVTVADVFRDDGIGFFAGTNFNTKLQNALQKLDVDDYIHVNTQVEVLSGGYKINRRDYLSFGFYSEADASVSMPKDIATLINEGNAAYLNKDFTLSQANVKADVFGVLHVGLSRRFNNRFTAGARLKVYSGSTNVTTTDNQGTFTTRSGTNNIYEHTLSGVDASVYSSGIYNQDNEADITVGSAINGTFFSGNFGLGLDFGLTYHLSEQLEVTASVLDIGFINYSKDTRNVTIKGDYTFSGVEFQYDPNNAENYWTQLRNDFNAKVPHEENKESYSVMRPIKFNSSLAYSFGKSRNIANCHDISFKDYYDNTVGGQLYSIFLPTGPKFALTGFYQRKISKHLNTKITYTVDEFSSSNIGLGVSVNVWKLNIYGAAGNVFKLFDVADANTTSLQFGINYIVN